MLTFCQFILNCEAIKITLTDKEKTTLRHSKVSVKDIQHYTVDELEVLLGASLKRAKEVRALAEFQTIQSVGIRFAEDLISLGYYTIAELKGKDGAKLTDKFEKLKGYWIDPCVEDQFRLVVHYANTNDNSKNWWDFTKERKEYRAKKGYPSSRPAAAWHEVLGTKAKSKEYKKANRPS